VFELGSKIQTQVQSEIEKGQREFFLRQQLKAIQDELGESDPERAEIDELASGCSRSRFPRTCARLRSASSPGSSACPRPQRSTA
jgi:ATP-dependent Lon protease